MTELNYEDATPEVRGVRFWQLIVPLVATAAVLAVLVLFGGTILAAITGRSFTSQEITDYLSRPGMNYAFLQIMLAAIYIVALIALRMTIGRAGRTRMTADFRRTSMKWIVIGVVSGVLLVVLVAVVTAVLQAQGVEFKQGEAEKVVMPHSPGQLLMAVATIVIAGPYFEELYFRGALMSWLKDKAGIFVAIVIGSALFALAHGQFVMAPGTQGWVATGLLGMVGVVNSVLAWCSGSLWPPFATHAAFNGTMVALGFLAPEMQT